MDNEINLELHAEPLKSKRVQGGESTTNVVCSSMVGDNSELFAQITELFLSEGQRVADVTYGKGVFWRCIDTHKFDFYPTDLKTGVDARNLPYSNDFLDACVLDPPYMEGLLRNSTDQMAGSGAFSSFRDYYSNSAPHVEAQLKYHDRVIDLYMQISLEVRRVLKDKGIFIVKCQDEVSANRQKLTHVELLFALEQLGFYCEDIFILVRKNRPAVSRLKKQVHARKNHSYFLVLRLYKESKIPYSNFGHLLLSYSKYIAQESQPDLLSMAEKEET